MKEKYSGYFRWAVTAICTVSICLVIFFLMFRSKEFATFFKKLSNVLLPIIIGAIIAYLINPIVNFIHKYLTRFFIKLRLTPKKAGNLALGISIFLSLSILIGFIYFLISLILPELYRNVKNFVNNFEDYVNTITTWVSELEVLKKYPEVYEGLSSALTKMLDSLENWITTSLLGTLSNLLSGITLRIIGFLNVLLDAVVGLIVSVYILYSKRKYVGKAKRFTYVWFKPKTANTILQMASECNRIFSGFISGKLLDSLIIGMMCFLGMTIFKMPYPLLVSVIVGVTNVIPFFGPFIGAIPSAILILLSDPTNLKPTIFFVIFVICLQQFDGNILGPKILGDSTGISALMVVVSILVGGGFFGFMGMFLGVPTFAVFNYLSRCFIHYRLKKKGLPEGHVNYLDLTHIDDDAGEMHYCVSGLNTVSGEPISFVKHFKKVEPEEATFAKSLKANNSKRDSEDEEELARLAGTLSKKRAPKKRQSRSRAVEHKKKNTVPSEDQLTVEIAPEEDISE